MLTTGERLKRARIAKGLTQRQLGKLSGVGHAWISRVEKDERQDISLHKARLVCEALGIRLDYLAAQRKTAHMGYFPSREVEQDDVLEELGALDPHDVPEVVRGVVIGDDGSCCCAAAAPCPLGKGGPMARCTLAELLAEWEDV